MSTKRNLRKLKQAQNRLARKETCTKYALTLLRESAEVCRIAAGVVLGMVAFTILMRISCILSLLLGG